VIPCCFALEGDRLYTAVDAKPKTTMGLQRLRNVRANPSVTVLVDEYDEDWARLWWVRARGQARVLAPDDPAARRGVRLLADKYQQYRRQRPAGPVLEISLDDVRWWEGSQHV
jgi:PPOX class probable F420-dependent enzyme